MQRVRTFFSTLTSIISPNAETPASAPDPQAMLLIQKSMLRVLGVRGAELNPQLEHRIRFAPSIEALWFLRADLAQALCLQRDENSALQAVTDLTPLFDGHIAKSQLQAFQLGHRGPRRIAERK
ncbi:hypothetical protein [Hydrogenophaga sp. BPS33]|uniref:hypothetical protein n=1 Tax=Hydrogenophaga sp. BPS33 TaxID=2651974 RepID=UPI00131FDED0|nr:hypothetical protein [Hydrogenophaga sp. BPS33]QHE87064.1 hypothetical protein F9K07_20245 [Hydrogenophaga sp. BPS33]